MSLCSGSEKPGPCENCGQEVTAVGMATAVTKDLRITKSNQETIAAPGPASPLNSAGIRKPRHAGLLGAITWEADRGGACSLGTKGFASVNLGLQKEVLQMKLELSWKWLNSNFTSVRRWYSPN